MSPLINKIVENSKKGRRQSLSSFGRVFCSRNVSLSSCGLWFDYESGQSNDSNFVIHSFPAGRSALKEQCGEQAGKFTCCVVGKDT